MQPDEYAKQFKRCSILRDVATVSTANTKYEGSKTTSGTEQRRSGAAFYITKHPGGARNEQKIYRRPAGQGA